MRGKARGLCQGSSTCLTLRGFKRKVPLLQLGNRGTIVVGSQSPTDRATSLLLAAQSFGDCVNHLVGHAAQALHNRQVGDCGLDAVKRCTSLGRGCQ